MATNTFYGPFDTETLPGSVQKKPGEYRSAFEIDRDRIVFSYAFRRLQSKTQVFQSGEFDFYRTRLTHSLEVSKIGRSLCHFLEATSPLLRPDFHIDPDLVEAGWPLEGTSISRASLSSSTARILVDDTARSAQASLNGALKSS